MYLERRVNLTARSPALAVLRKIYMPLFMGTDLHHMIPKSRNGGSGEFNIFPYKEKSHSDYHYILWNMKINEVWDMRQRIHASIFNSPGKFIIPWWVESCRLESGTPEHRENFDHSRQERLKKQVSLKVLQRNWIGAFGGHDLVTAEEFMKVMMLFMIFGAKIVDPQTLFNNGNLGEFFEDSLCTNYRLWAFNICFGEGGSAQSMKSKIARILNRNSFYLP